MTPQEQIALDPEQTFALLTTRAATSGDRFFMRLFRKRGAIGAGETLASFVDVTINQLSQPEPWIAKLCGGGEYTLQVAHMEKTQERIGGLLKFKVPGDLRAVNPFAPQGADWEGPLVMTYPTPGTAPATTAGPGAFAPVGGAGLGPPRPQQQWGWDATGQPMGPGFSTMQAPGVPADTLFMREQAATEKHAARERELTIREAAMNKAMVEREEKVKRDELEARMRAENERVRTESEARARSLEEKLTRAVESTKAPAGPGIGEIITGIAAALGPLIAPLIASASENRRDTQRLAHEASLQARADAAANQALLLKMLDKPAGLPAEVTMLFEMQKGQNQNNADMMTRMVDAMGAVSKTSVAMIEAVADLGGGGEPESPGITMMREGVKAVTMLISGAKDGAKKQIAAQQQQRMPSQPTQQPVQQQQANGQGLPNGAGAHPNGHGNAPGSQATPAGATATGPQQPQPVAAAQEETPNGLREAPRNSLEELERLIRNRYEPIERVADFFIASLKTDEMKAALAEVDGDINDLMFETLGDWIEESTQNSAYITRLAEAVDTAGTAAGVFRKEDQDEQQQAQPATQP